MCRKNQLLGVFLGGLGLGFLLSMIFTSGFLRCSLGVICLIGCILVTGKKSAC